MPHPLGFTAIERDIIIAAAEPINPEHRAGFFEAVLTALALAPVLGEGLVHRTCRELQKRFVDLPRSPQRRGNASRAWRG